MTKTIVRAASGGEHWQPSTVSVRDAVGTFIIGAVASTLVVMGVLFDQLKLDDPMGTIRVNCAWAVLALGPFAHGSCGGMNKYLGSRGRASRASSTG